MKNALRIAAALLVTTVSIAAERHSIAYSPTLGAALGIGWDTLSGRPANNVCVTGTGTAVPFSDKQISVQRVHDSYSLNKLLRVSFEGSASYGPAKARSRTIVERETTTQNSAVNWLLSAKVSNGLNYLTGDPLELKEWAAALLKSDPNAFRSRCGDSFVVAMESGASSHALYQFFEDDATKRLKLERELDASGKVAGVGGSAGVKALYTLTEHAKSTRTKISFMQEGGHGGSLPTTAEEVNTIVAGLAENAKEHSKPIRLQLQSYSTIARATRVDTPNTEYAERLYEYARQLDGILGEIKSMLADRNSVGLNVAPAATGYDWELHQNAGYELDLWEMRDRLVAEIADVESELDEWTDSQNPHPCAYTKPRLERTTVACNQEKDSSSREWNHRDVDDFRWVLGLPIPKAALDPSKRTALLAIMKTTPAGKTPSQAQLEQYRIAYGVVRFFFWIVRTDQIRCEMLQQCLQGDEMRGYLERMVQGGGADVVGMAKSGATVPKLLRIMRPIPDGFSSRFLDDLLVNGSLVSTGVAGDVDDKALDAIPDDMKRNVESSVSRVFVGRFDNLDIKSTSRSSWGQQYKLYRYRVENGQVASEPDVDYQVVRGARGAFYEPAGRVFDYVYEIVPEFKPPLQSWLTYTGTKTKGSEIRTQRMHVRRVALRCDDYANDQNFTDIMLEAVATPLLRALAAEGPGGECRSPQKPGDICALGVCGDDGEQSVYKCDEDMKCSDAGTQECDPETMW